VKDVSEDESNFKNRTLRFTNNNFLGGVTSASGFGGPQNSNLKVPLFDGAGWAADVSQTGIGLITGSHGRNMGSHIVGSGGANINDQDEGA
jgi:hypothetical protein